MTRYIYAAAVAAIGAGTALVYAGVLSAAFFTAGVVLIGIGLLLAAAGGAADTFLPRQDDVADSHVRS